jgi:hypothetical protein
MKLTLASSKGSSPRMFVSKIKTGRTGNPEHNAILSAELSSSRRSLLNQKIFILRGDITVSIPGRDED